MGKGQGYTDEHIAFFQNRGPSSISKADLKRILPTITGHINFIGQFNLDFNRKPLLGI